MIEKGVFLIHLASTWMMCGILWFAQIDYYPLLAFVGKSSFKRYEKEHIQRTIPWAVFLLSVELVTGILLLFLRPASISVNEVVAGLVLLAFGWYLTWGGCVPMHKALKKGFNAKSHALLLNRNAGRVWVWTLRGLLVLWMLK